MNVHESALLIDRRDAAFGEVARQRGGGGYTVRENFAVTRASLGSPCFKLFDEVGRQSTEMVAVNDAKVSAAVRYIRAHTDDGIDVGDVLRAVPMSRRLLERCFNTLLGHTHHEHIQRTKLARARAMLAETELSVALIAERTGFEHSEYLSVAFRRETGFTPSAYRQKHRATCP